MNRSKIVTVRDLCAQMVEQCDMVLRDMDRQVAAQNRAERRRDPNHVDRAADDADVPRPSAATGALRRASMDLTRALARLRASN